MKRLSALAALAVLAAVPAAAQDAAPDAAKPRLTLAELRTRYADSHGHIAVIGGVEVYYKDEGRGPVLLLVHGSVSTLRTWDRIVPVLARHYRVIRYDVPPGGLSGRVSDASAAALVPADIAEGLLARLDVKRVTFVGVSSGGTLGIQLAAKRPDLVERLILSNTPADPVTTDHLPPAPEFDRQQKIATETGFRSLSFWNEFLDYFSAVPARIGADTRREYYDFNRRVPEKYPLDLVAQVADHTAAVAAMTKVTAPVLLIWGGKDLLLTPPSMDVLAGYLTHAQVSKILLPDVGHYPPLEVPERFAQLIQAYIEAATPARQ